LKNFGFKKNRDITSIGRHNRCNRIDTTSVVAPNRCDRVDTTLVVAPNRCDKIDTISTESYNRCNRMDTTSVESYNWCNISSWVLLELVFYVDDLFINRCSIFTYYITCIYIGYGIDVKCLLEPI